MKYTEFQALSNVTTKAAALLLAQGTKFLFNETQIFQYGDMASSNVGKKNNNQQKRTSIRHKIHYYVRDNSSTGYHQVFDILEADDAANQTKTATRPGLSSRVETRDDNDRRGYKSTDWS